MTTSPAVSDVAGTFPTTATGSVEHASAPITPTCSPLTVVNALLATSEIVDVAPATLAIFKAGDVGTMSAVGARVHVCMCAWGVCVCVCVLFLCVSVCVCMCVWRRWHALLGRL